MWISLEKNDLESLMNIPEAHVAVERNLSVIPKARAEMSGHSLQRDLNLRKEKRFQPLVLCNH